MPPKRKGRAKKKAKINNEETDACDTKRKIFQNFLDDLDKQAADYVKKIDAEYEEARQNVVKLYADKLSEMPEKYRKMTISEFIQEQAKQKKENDDAQDCEAATIIKRKERQYSTSKSKSKPSMTGKKLASTHRRSLSCPNSKNRKVLGVLQPCTPFNPLTRCSRVVSESALNTPSTNVKFQPRTPVPLSFMRKPRVGELLSEAQVGSQVWLSESGSPVQNIVDSESDAPAIILKFGKGKILNIAEGFQEGSKSCYNQLDDGMKETVKNLLKDMLKD